jgi:hypothetical protein
MSGLAGLHLPGAIREEAQANIKEAITDYLASLKRHGEPIPPPITEELSICGMTRIPVLSGRNPILYP